MAIRIIAGPPGSGKSTIVSRLFSKGDILIDLDRIYEAITNLNSHNEKDIDLLKISLYIRSCLYEYIRRYVRERNVWVIACMPNGRKREMLSRQLCDAKVYLVKTTPEECMKNILNDESREYSEQYAQQIVDEWFTKFSSSRKDCDISVLF